MDTKDDIRIRKVIEAQGEGFCEYYYEICNESSVPVFLDRVTLFSCGDPCSLGLERGEYVVFRSGRHKNDMPGVFVSGQKDERLLDVCSGMSESGDKEAADKEAAGYRVVSDHLTLLRDAAGHCYAIEFLGGREHLFETVIELDRDAHIRSISANAVFRRYLDPGESVVSEGIRTALVEDPQEEVECFARRKAERYGARNTRRPAVFCTWYFYELNVSYEDVKTNLRIMKERRLPYDVFQVDEGWEKTLGEYEPNEKFPLSMAELAKEIREAGYVPGLWSSPFVAHESAGIWKARPEWILREKDGKPCLFPMNGTVYYVFDITNPATCDYFRELYHRFTFEWDYPYHKLDFTRAAVIFEEADFYDKRITPAQAYYRAVRAIREGMGEEAFFLMCGGLYDPIIGLVDAQRTGSDVLSMWSSTINKNGKTAPYTIRQSAMRYYMNRWWANDPDALMIRRNEQMQRGSRLTLGLLTDEEVKTSVMNQFMGGGIMCQTEPLDQIDEDRLLQIRHLLPVTDCVTEPAELLGGERFPSVMKLSVAGMDAVYLCITNWSDTEEKALEVDLSACVPAEGKYAVCAFYSGEYAAEVDASAVVRFSPIKPHASELIKIERIGEKPIIVASDHHYSMGGECSVLEIAEQMLQIELPNLFPVDIHYKVLLPQGCACEGERIVDVLIEKEDPAIALLGVEVELDA